jgi:hypothetical protein
VFYSVTSAENSHHGFIIKAEVLEKEEYEGKHKTHK